jgi:hypothetical protein
MHKQDVLSLLDRLPDPLDPEQLMHELYLKAKIERAEVAIARGEVVAMKKRCAGARNGSIRLVASPALADLREIYHYIARDSRNYARATVDRITSTAASLAQ